MKINSPVRPIKLTIAKAVFFGRSSNFFWRKSEFRILKSNRSGGQKGRGLRRFNKLQKIVNKNETELVAENDVNIRQYAKYLLKEGNVSDKRELLANLRSKITYTNKKLKLK